MDIISKLSDYQRQMAKNEKYKFDLENQKNISLHFWEKQIKNAFDLVEEDSSHINIKTQWIPRDRIGNINLKVLTQNTKKCSFFQPFKVEIVITISEIFEYVQGLVLMELQKESKDVLELSKKKRKTRFANAFSKHLVGEFLHLDNDTKAFFEEHYLIAKQQRNLYLIISPDHFFLKDNMDKIILVSHLMLLEFRCYERFNFNPSLHVFEEFPVFLNRMQNTLNNFVAHQSRLEKKIQFQKESVEMLRDQILSKNEQGIRLEISNVQHFNQNLEKKISEGEEELRSLMQKIEKMIKNQSLITQKSLEVEFPLVIRRKPSKSKKRPSRRSTATSR